MNKRILFGASYSAIEPLGLLHLGGLARDAGWERDYCLVKDHDYTELERTVRDFKPDIVGFNVYTGNHLQAFATFDKLRRDNPSTRFVLGGPHPTYFPVETATHADDVVMREGFAALQSILEGGKPGIFPGENTPRFPHPDRATFYDRYPEHAKSAIKSIITMTGCPYACTYCYNSSKPEDIKDGLPADVYAKLKGSGVGMGGRLFPHNVRNVDDVVAEGRDIADHWPDTKMIYFQDDVHGFDIKNGGWMAQFAPRWKQEVAIPYHAQVRWEMVNPKTEGMRRLDLMQEAGCFGLTLAIEAADPTIRVEVLDRGMPQELMHTGMDEILGRGMKVRTEQITALPYGATSKPTPMNLAADLQLVELNVHLAHALKHVRGPLADGIAWYSSLAPYKRTKIGSYCEQYGHYEGQNNDVPDTFFDHSVLRFPKEWVGQSLAQRKNDPGIWLDGQSLERYRDQNAELRRMSYFFSAVPEGHTLAHAYLTSDEPYGFERLGREAIAHLQRLGTDQSRLYLEDIASFRTAIPDIAQTPDERHSLEQLAGYFGSLSLGERAAERFLREGCKRGDLSSKTLSTATRHHLYDEVTYMTGGNGAGRSHERPTSRQSTLKI